MSSFVKDTTYSREIEFLVLGQAINFKKALDVVCELDDDDFFVSEHKFLLSLLKTMKTKRKSISLQFLLEEIKKSKKTYHIGPTFLIELSQNACIEIEIREYIDYLKESSSSRKALYCLKQAQDDIEKDPKNTIYVIDNLKTNLEYTLSKSKLLSSISIINILNKDKTSFIKQIKERYDYRKTSNKDFQIGLPTGFSDIDDKTSLLNPGNLVVIAARPSVGKTAFALNMVVNICYRNKHPLAFFSLEMTQEQIVERMFSLLSKISCDDLRKGNILDQDILNLESIEHNFKKTSLFICDNTLSTVSELCLQAKKLKNEHDIKILFIDYIQLLEAQRVRENRQNEIAEISRKLKVLATDLNIPIVCISQLSRKVEDRVDKRPLMSDLRDSGQIEQDADVIIFLYRKDYYNPEENPGVAEVFLGKNRHGQTFSIFLKFDYKIGLFSSRNQEW